MVSFGQLRKDLVANVNENKVYAFYPNGHTIKVTMTLRQRFLADDLFFGDYENDSNNLAASILRCLLKVIKT